MNDATRELGAAFGVAVLGSLAASRYGGQIGHLVAGLPTSAQAAAKTSLAAALQTAGTLPHAAGARLAAGANAAFVSGFHLAVAVGAALAFLSAVIVARYLPHRLTVAEHPAGMAVAIDDAGAGAPVLEIDLEEEPELAS